jgi:hypothetical protein
MVLDPYLLSFTGSSLSVAESIKISEVYLELKDWEAVERKVKSENLLQARTKSSVQRVYQELAPRLQQLSQEQLELLVDGTPQEQKQLLWLAVCKRYSFIREFAVEVLHEKHLRLEHQLTEFDYDAFYNRKADWHPELDALEDTTRGKLKTRLFRMLLEAGLITKDRRIIPVVFSQRMVDVLLPDAPMSFEIYPVSQSEIRR